MQTGGLPIVTAAEMRAAEDQSIATGATIDTLMTRAGEAVAEQVRRLAAGAEVLVLCGPGNNGGDGYVAAAALKRAGNPVRVAAFGEPRSAAAVAARTGWSGPVEPLSEATGAPVILDAIFGIGQRRALGDAIAAPLGRLIGESRMAIAIDLPSGLSSDEAICLATLPPIDLTLALGALKPAHVLHPAAQRCGAIRVLDIGVAVDASVRVASMPRLRVPATDAHKFSRGMVAVVAGKMAGAGALAATAAGRGGAGYVLLLGSATDRLPHAIVRRRFTAHALGDERIGAVVIGPGLGRDDAAKERLDAALSCRHPLVVDGDALHLLDGRQSEATMVITPHAGEFSAMFGDIEGNKIAKARQAAHRSGAVVVFKGADTVIAAPDGRVAVHADSPSWLASAGTGDVLAGLIGARLAAGGDPFAAAEAGVWLHAEAARLAGPALIADDLAAHLPVAIERCL